MALISFLSVGNQFNRDVRQFSKNALSIKRIRHSILLLINIDNVYIIWMASHVS